MDRHAHAVVHGRGEVRRQAVRLAAEHPCGRPGQDRGYVRVVQVKLAAAVGGQQGEPGPAAGIEHRSGVAVAGQRQVEDAAGGGAHGLAVVRVHGVAGEQHRTGARGVGHADHRAGVARVRDPDQHRDQCGRAGKRGPDGHVEKIADRDEALRGDGVRERLRSPVGDQGDPHLLRAGGSDQLGVPVSGRRRHEQLVHSQIAYGGGGERLADGLGALDEEPPGPIAARAAQQLACCDHARGALGTGRLPGFVHRSAQAAVPS